MFLSLIIFEIISNSTQRYQNSAKNQSHQSYECEKYLTPRHPPTCQKQGDGDPRG